MTKQEIERTRELISAIEKKQKSIKYMLKELNQIIEGANNGN